MLSVKDLRLVASLRDLEVIGACMGKLSRFSRDFKGDLAEIAAIDEVTLN